MYPPKKPSRWVRIKQLCWAHFASERRRARHALQETDRFYLRLIAKAKRLQKRDLHNAFVGEWQSVREPKQDEFDGLETIHWCKRAARYHVPLPERTDTYWITKSSGFHHLNTAGIDYLERAISEKLKWRFNYLVVLTALIGAIAGLAALLKQC